jgi:hypothetical protein
MLGKSHYEHKSEDAMALVRLFHTDGYGLAYIEVALIVGTESQRKIAPSSDSIGQAHLNQERSRYESAEFLIKTAISTR